MPFTTRLCHRLLLVAVGAALTAAYPTEALAKAQRHRPAPHRAATASAHGSPASRGRPQSATTAKALAEPKPRAAGPAGRTVVARRGNATPVFEEHETIRPLIVIDAGHGGRDPGAIGAGGTREKDVTLAVALELRRMLDATGRYRTALTRTRDETVSLPGRLDFAQDRDADLLIAIHADASPDRRARGASVYVSNGNGLRHLAATAGNSGRIAQALSGGGRRSAPSSAWLQQSMIDQLSDEVDMVVAPARAAHLYVLGSRSIPGVLLETGFISNRQEEVLLRQPAYRRRLVGAVKDAVDDYFLGLKANSPRT
jgi:N-acetylmuramoyl-L-alanine amidase